MSTPVDAVTERHQHICDRLEAVGRVEVADLASALDVAPETVRRDLRLLERQGLLQRVHGGAVRRTEQPLSPFDRSVRQHAPHQLALADLVANRLPIGGTLLLGSSSVMAAVAESLARRPAAEAGLTIVTGNLDAAVTLSRVDRFRVFNTGGDVDDADRSQHGEWALAELDRFHVDLAVLAVPGVTAGGGVFADSPLRAATTGAEMRAARCVWLLVEPEALGAPALMQAADLRSVAEIMVAGAVDAEKSAGFAEVGIAVTGLS